MIVLRTPRRVAQTAGGAGLAVFLTVVACGQFDATEEANRGGAIDLRSERIAGNQSWQSVVPVYWTGTGDQSGRLFREPITVTTSDTADPIESAVMAMTQATPADTDYSSLWPPVTSLGTSFSRGVITLDLPSKAVSQRMEPDRAELAVQQLVHTAVAAAQSSDLVAGEALPQVRILIDGESGQEIFGSHHLPEKISADREALAGVSLEPERLQVEPGVLTVAGRVTDPVHDVELTVETLGATAEDRESASPTATATSASTTEVRQRIAVKQDYAQADVTGSGAEISRTLEVKAGSYRVAITATDVDGRRLSDDFVVTVAEPQ